MFDEAKQPVFATMFRGIGQGGRESGHIPQEAKCLGQLMVVFM